MPSIRFSPRRLGHVNLWVSDLERSSVFYERVCGLELVRRERMAKIAFHSNGNTHHDIGIIEISRGVDRYGRNGLLQIPKTRGTAVGLNHLGWEMENEQLLVDAYRRALAAELPTRTMDHVISHSVYVNDPDGNAHECYADQMRDWRSIFHLGREDEVTGPWDPLTAAPGTRANYDIDPPIHSVDVAPLHPRHLTDATFSTRRFDAMHDFFEDVLGLDEVENGAQLRRFAVFAGAAGRADVTIVEVGEGEPTGLRSFTFVLGEQANEAEVSRRLAGQGVTATRTADELGRDVLCLRDPDNFEVRFSVPVLST